MLFSAIDIYCSSHFIQFVFASFEAVYDIEPVQKEQVVCKRATADSPFSLSPVFFSNVTV